ncbi:hypothetical protein BGE01nite_38190 [Brevifollis gellanilyticus]|uniref:Sialidase domain-containing protein n=2 Tax=Brevifollis gellanilyticus TaxID=748831 RepID=A0A512MCS3_9BACT|nr:hypothetical protein BGE01nite_38190 [Brevifollis gellanilyticus]
MTSIMERRRRVFAPCYLPTMKRAFLSLLALSLAPVCSPAADDYKGDVTDVRVVRHMDQHPGASLLWEPYITQWKPKQLIVAYGAGIPGKTDMGDIYASVSTNDGDTWSYPVCVFDHNQRFGAMQFAYANAILFHPPGQDVVWCFAMRCPMNYRHSEDAQLVAAFSGDGGRSWSPVELAMHYSQPLIVVAGIETIMENGHPKYLLPAHRNTLRSNPLGSRDQFILSSTSLLEWKAEGIIPQPETGKVFLHEGGLAPGDNDGELKLVMRTANWEEKAALDPPRAFSSVSKDGGRTWSPAVQEPDLWNARSKGYFGRTSAGAHVYVYNDGPAMPAKAGRSSLRYKVKPKGGEWSAEKTFYEAGIKNSYPTLIEVAPGDYRAVWDSGTPDQARTHIHFGKIKIKP